MTFWAVSGLQIHTTTINRQQHVLSCNDDNIKFNGHVDHTSTQLHQTKKKNVANILLYSQDRFSTPEYSIVRECITLCNYITTHSGSTGLICHFESGIGPFVPKAAV